MAHKKRNPYDESGAWGHDVSVPGTQAMTREPDSGQERSGFYSESPVPGKSSMETVEGIETSPYLAQILRSDSSKDRALRQYFDQLAASQTPPDQAWGPVADQMRRQQEKDEVAGEQEGRLKEATIAKTQAEAKMGDPVKELRRQQVTDETSERQVYDEAQRTGNMDKLTNIDGKPDQMALQKALARLRAGQPAFDDGGIKTQPDSNQQPQQQPTSAPAASGGGTGGGFGSDILKNLFGQAFGGPGGTPGSGQGKGKIRNIRVVR